MRLCRPSIDVFVYPYALHAAPLVAAMAFTTTDTTHVGTGVVLGSLVAVALKRRGQIVLTLQHVYGLHDTMLKARVDMTQAQLAHTDARVFVHDLVARMAAGAP